MAQFYGTGNASNVNDLMALFKDHLVNDAGFTLDSYVTEGTGRRCHVHKGGIYFNFRSYVAEAVPVGGATQTGIFFNCGDNYSGAAAWYNQSGVMKYDSNTKYLIPGMVQLTGAIVAYHFYHFDDTDYDVNYFFVESPAGTFQRMLFGRMKRSTFGTHWTSGIEGAFYGGSQGHNSALYSNALNIAGENSQGYWNHNNAKFACFGSVPNGGTAYWLNGDFSIPQSQLSPARVQCFDSISKCGSLWLDTPNSFNSLPIQMPVTINVTLDSVASLSSATPNIPWCPVGELPFIYWVNLFSLSPGANITVASDSYKVFPFRKKSDVWSAGDASVGTYRFGLAVKNV